MLRYDVHVLYSSEYILEELKKTLFSYKWIISFLQLSHQVKNCQTHLYILEIL